MSISDLYYESNRYLAFVLSDDSRKHILEVCPPTFKKVICHHVTIAFNPDERTFDDFKKKYEDKTPEVRATGILIGDTIEAITVTLDGATKREFATGGGYYHVTLSLDPPSKPVDSNNLFGDHDAKKITFHKAFILKGDFQLCKL